VSEESQVHDSVRHPFKYPTDKVANISKKISISIKFPDGMKIVKTGISFTELKDMIRELKETHKEDVKAQQRLMKAIDEMTRRQADTDAENKELRQEIKNLLSRISVSNKVRFGSTSQKGTKKNAAPVQDREKDKEQRLPRLYNSYGKG
jgi:predicted nuclease with TOPRIM domain